MTVAKIEKFIELNSYTDKFDTIEGIYICTNGHIYDREGNRLDRDEDINEQGYKVYKLFPNSKPCSIHKLQILHNDELREEYERKEREARATGRKVEIHHKDGNRKNNRLDNLEIEFEDKHKEEHAIREELPISVIKLGLSNEALIMLGLIRKQTKGSYQVKGLKVSSIGYRNFIKNRVPLTEKEVYKAIEELSRNKLIKGTEYKGYTLYISLI